MYFPTHRIDLFFLSRVPNIIHRSPSQVSNLANFFYFGATAPPPQWARASSFTRFLEYTKWSTTFGRTPLYEWSFRSGDLYLTTHNTQNRQTSIPPVGFEPSNVSRRAAAELRPEIARPPGPANLAYWKIFLINILEKFICHAPSLAIFTILAGLCTSRNLSLYMLNCSPIADFFLGAHTFLNTLYKYGSQFISK